ncbi:MAG: ribosome-associated translation inhibitor RaiA [Phycisphaeraceae bacterium]|nr:ribosome-associated translation inhibitor RaiA [Phycisphaeraceae bacterium]
MLRTKEGSNMEITVSGRHLEVTDPIRQYNQEKAGRLPRFFDRVHRCEAVLDKTAEGFEVEWIIHVAKADVFVAKSRGMDLYACIDDVAAKAERQLTDHKEKIKNHHKHG